MALPYLIASLLAVIPPEIGGHMLYLIHKGETEKAFQNYIAHTKENHEHDFFLLQQAALRILEKGANSGDEETLLMCMFGAGAGTSHELLPILEKGLHSKEMKTQLVALGYLSRLQDDDADRLILQALSSPFPITRLEALFQLAQKNHPETLQHLQSFMLKVPHIIRAVFGEIVVHLESEEASAFMRQLLADTDLDVRIETILTLAKAKRDDFLPQIRSLATQTQFAQQECAAFALGHLRDTQSLPLLKELAKSQRTEVELAASISLFQLGDRSCVKLIEKQAGNGDLFAITALGIIEEGREILVSLLSHEDRDIRLNAILALSRMGDRRSLPHVKEILIPEGRDIGFYRVASAGRGLKAWRCVASAAQNTKAFPGIVENTLGLRETLLAYLLEFPTDDFLQVAKLIMDRRQYELFPLLVELLENCEGEETIQFLKEGRQKAGAPLIRHYCTLALYRLQEEGPYESDLIEWAKQEANHPIIRFREENSSSQWNPGYQLTPEETSHFLITVFETLAKSQNQVGIETLIHAIAHGHPKNRYALAGLLMRTTE